jgi:hypothetical protein
VLRIHPIDDAPPPPNQPPQTRLQGTIMKSTSTLFAGLLIAAASAPALAADAYVASSPEGLPPNIAFWQATPSSQSAGSSQSAQPARKATDTDEGLPPAVAARQAEERFGNVVSETRVADRVTVESDEGLPPNIAAIRNGVGPQAARFANQGRTGSNS